MLAIQGMPGGEAGHEPHQHHRAQREQGVPGHAHPAKGVHTVRVEEFGAPGIWISAVAAYGSFIIPAIFRIQVDAGAPQRALYQFTGFYALCLVLNGWQFARRK